MFSPPDLDRSIRYFFFSVDFQEYHPQKKPLQQKLRQNVVFIDSNQYLRSSHSFDGGRGQGGNAVLSGLIVSIG
jgi:hypothetical protein